MSKSAKVKGNCWELKVAKGFSSWLDCSIRRTPLSGGWGGAATKADLLSVDDPPNPRTSIFNRWFVECKAVEAIDPLHLLTSQGIINIYLAKLLKECTDRHPVLVIKKNYQEPFALFDVKGLALATPYDYTLDKPNLTFRYRTVEFAFICLDRLYQMPIHKELFDTCQKDTSIPACSGNSLIEVSPSFLVELPPFLGNTKK